MSAPDAIKTLITPLLPGWRVQFGRWVDGNTADRYAVIKPVGGGMAGLVRRPQYTLTLIGALNDPAAVPSMAADSIIQAMRTNSGSLVLMEAGEPVFSNATDGRPIFELAISTITV